MDVKKLQEQYSALAPKAERLKKLVVEEFGKLLSDNGLVLGVPMESRVKEWLSTREKLEREKLDDIKRLPDLIGVRSILLFRPDLELVGRLIRETFEVERHKDTSAQLSESQFGYQSQHYVVKPPRAWIEAPTKVDLDNLLVEIQVRTLAQHIWAAASHKLQYKREAGVPLPVRRSIHRVAALLETVDLEFDRVLAERERYQSLVASEKPSELLNVDALASVLSEVFPAANRKANEPYDDLLANLIALGVTTIGDTKQLMKKHREAVLKRDRNAVTQLRKLKNYIGPDKDRINKGVHFSHVRLARLVLEFEFNERALDVFEKQIWQNS